MAAENIAFIIFAETWLKLYFLNRWRPVDMKIRLLTTISSIITDFNFHTETHDKAP